MISGASDDLIWVRGELHEEFYLHNEKDGDLLAFSDGTLLRVQFDSDGTWRITRLMRGQAAMDLDQAEAGGGTDTVTLDLIGAFTWVVQGIAHVKART